MTSCIWGSIFHTMITWLCETGFRSNLVHFYTCNYNCIVSWQPLVYVTHRDIHSCLVQARHRAKFLLLMWSLALLLFNYWPESDRNEPICWKSRHKDCQYALCMLNSAVHYYCNSSIQLHFDHCNNLLFLSKLVINKANQFLNHVWVHIFSEK
jgi:hypothetical protein